MTMDTLKMLIEVCGRDTTIEKTFDFLVFIGMCGYEVKEVRSDEMMSLWLQFNE